MKFHLITLYIVKNNKHSCCSYIVCSTDLFYKMSVLSSILDIVNNRNSCELNNVDVQIPNRNWSWPVLQTNETTVSQNSVTQTDIFSDPKIIEFYESDEIPQYLDCIKNVYSSGEYTKEDKFTAEKSGDQKCKTLDLKIFGISKMSIDKEQNYNQLTNWLHSARLHDNKNPLADNSCLTTHFSVSAMENESPFIFKSNLNPINIFMKNELSVNKFKILDPMHSEINVDGSPLHNKTYYQNSNSVGKCANIISKNLSKEASLSNSSEENKLCYQFNNLPNKIDNTVNFNSKTKDALKCEQPACSSLDTQATELPEFSENIQFSIGLDETSKVSLEPSKYIALASKIIVEETDTDKQQLNIKENLILTDTLNCEQISAHNKGNLLDNKVVDLDKSFLGLSLELDSQDSIFLESIAALHEDVSAAAFLSDAVQKQTIENVENELSDDIIDLTVNSPTKNIEKVLDKADLQVCHKADIDVNWKPISFTSAKPGHLKLSESNQVNGIGTLNFHNTFLEDFLMKKESIAPKAAITSLLSNNKNFALDKSQREVSDKKDLVQPKIKSTVSLKSGTVKSVVTIIEADRHTAKQCNNRTFQDQDIHVGPGDNKSSFKSIIKNRHVNTIPEALQVHSVTYPPGDEHSSSSITAPVHPKIVNTVPLGSRTVKSVIAFIEDDTHAGKWFPNKAFNEDFHFDPGNINKIPEALDEQSITSRAQKKDYLEPFISKIPEENRDNEVRVLVLHLLNIAI